MSKFIQLCYRQYRRSAPFFVPKLSSASHTEDKMFDFCRKNCTDDYCFNDTTPQQTAMRLEKEQLKDVVAKKRLVA